MKIHNVFAQTVLEVSIQDHGFFQFVPGVRSVAVRWKNVDARKPRWSKWSQLSSKKRIVDHLKKYGVPEEVAKDVLKFARRRLAHIQTWKEW